MKDWNNNVKQQVHKRMEGRVKRSGMQGSHYSTVLYRIAL